MARSDDVKHQIVFLTIAKIAESLAAAVDGIAVDADAAALVDAHIQPRLEALLDVADSDDSGVVDTAVAAAWKAYSETRSGRG